MKNKNSMNEMSGKISQQQRGSTKNKSFNLSSSVANSINLFTPNESIDASVFAKNLFSSHSNYAGGKASSLSISPTTEKLIPQQWLDNVQTLYEPSQVKKLSKSKGNPLLNGRLVILGLCLLEPVLRSQLVKEDIFASLKKELEDEEGYKFHKVLTYRGHELYAPPESVPNQPDNPLKSLEDDLLGRTAFARYLARRISDLSLNEGAYAIHLYGAWGSGKSTILNFLRLLLEKKENKEKEKEQEKEWKVVEFNAWRHQHIEPPWWPLYKSIYTQTQKELNLWQRFNEYWWRFTSGRCHHLVGIGILVLISWILILFLFPSENLGSLSSIAKIADNLGKVLVLFVTLWGIIKVFAKSLIWGSAEAAQSFVQLTHDPMNSIKKRFSLLIDRINPKHLAIFIDDLDRCREDYVVELLEGIQTLFKEAPAVFVVAADRTWLNACYANSYDKLRSSVSEPGKPLGSLFLEKAFQFSTSVPGMPAALKKKYWQTLIQIKSEDNEDELATALNKANKIMQDANTEDEIIHAINETEDQSFLVQSAVREQAVIRLAAPVEIERTEHALKPLVEHLGMNPRELKRLVNSYSCNRALAILSQNDIEREQLALWTILSMRWPLLTEYLEKNPDKINQFGLDYAAPGIPEDLQPLFKDEHIKAIIQGGPGQLPLNEEMVRNCALLCG